MLDRPVPVLSNAYTYLPCLNVAMLGRPAENRRHSLAQLCGVFSDPSRPTDKIVLSFFSYRSLLMYKLVKGNAVARRISACSPHGCCCRR